MEPNTFLSGRPQWVACFFIGARQSHQIHEIDGWAGYRDQMGRSTYWATSN
jgi:hypothetical protein